jgi:hypothetical protein
MGRYYEQTENRSQLQQKIAADLRAKAAAKAKNEGEPNPYDQPRDGVEDSQYIKGTKQTTSLAWAWLAIFIMVIAVFVLFVVR